MSSTLLPDSASIRAEIYTIFRDYFDRAEKKRRWSIKDGIPWDQCNPALDPAIADVVESFCAVELYLPDYLSKLIPQVRANRGRAWMLANWGYEEAKHSMVLGDWLLRSGHRSEEQMADMEAEVFTHEWDLPHDNPRAMICYTMVQELATWLHYDNLRKLVGTTGDPALYRLLTLIAIDERAHYDFFRRLVKVYLDYDRQETLEQLRRVVNFFAMPAVHLLADSRRRVEAVKSLHIFDDQIYYYQVFEPVLAALGLSKADVRRRTSSRAIVAPGALA
jgi:acyl-[acyl-carrier-protein] desaturase